MYNCSWYRFFVIKEHIIEKQDFIFDRSILSFDTEVLFDCSRLAERENMKSIWLVIKQYIKDFCMPYELRERKPLTDEQYNELLEILKSAKKHHVKEI